MTIFVTKVWGYGEPSPPLQFSKAGARNSAVSKLKEGDLVLLVGTQGEPTDPSEQGMILGIMEPSHVPVQCLDFDLGHYDTDFDESGEYRWPYGLHNKKAWLIDDPIPFKDITTRNSFGSAAAMGIVELTEEEAQKVLSLKRAEISLMQPIKVRARIEGEETARKRGAPPPTTRRRGVMHMRKAPAYTYVLELVGSDKPSFKIGWAFDYKQRMKTFNHTAMPQIGGIRYKALYYQLWPTAKQAFRMEQELLEKFEEYRHGFNHEILYDIEKTIILDEFTKYLTQKK